MAEVVEVAVAVAVVVSGYHHTQSDQDMRRFRRAAFFSGLKSKVVLLIAKASALHVNLNVDSQAQSPRVRTYPSHSQTS